MASKTQRPELPGSTGPLEEPLEQVLPVLPSRELQAGSHLQEVNHQPPRCLLSLFALQHTPHGTSPGWREGLAASCLQHPWDRWHWDSSACGPSGLHLCGSTHLQQPQVPRGVCSALAPAGTWVQQQELEGDLRGKTKPLPR